jgi:hypothetical protein
LLKEDKFGFFKITQQKLVKPQFDAIPKLLQGTGNIKNNELSSGPYFWQTEKEGKKGLSDAKGNTLLPFKFEAIHYWNDSLVWATDGDTWNLYDLSRKKDDENKTRSAAVNPFDATIHRLKQVYESDSRSIVKIYASTDYERGYSIIDSKEGAITKPVFNDIIVLGNETTIKAGNQLYLAIKRVKEADVSVLLYLNEKGKRMARFVVNEEDLEKMICE